MKTPVDRFLYHQSQSWQALEELIDSWKPEKEKYASSEELVSEFLEYYNNLAGRELVFFAPQDLKEVLSKSKYEVV